MVFKTYGVSTAQAKGAPAMFEYQKLWQFFLCHLTELQLFNPLKLVNITSRSKMYKTNGQKCPCYEYLAVLC